MNNENEQSTRWFFLNVHEHIIISGLRQHLATGYAVDQLSPDLRRNTLVCLEAQEVEKSLLLVGGDIGFVTLGKDQECLVPENGHRPGVHLESQKVVDQSVNDLVRESVLFIQ